jgi:hypothetical protein
MEATMDQKNKETNRKIQIFVLAVALLTISQISISKASEKFYVYKLKLINLFIKMLYQPFNFKSLEGEWPMPSRSDKIYPGS